MRASYGLVVLPALVGTVPGALADLSPGSGVAGTPGSLLALVGAAAVTTGGALAFGDGVGRWLDLLLGLGAVLTALAPWLLMQDAFAAAMAPAVLGLVAATLGPDRQRLAR